jgi:hypothetical protein
MEKVFSRTCKVPIKSDTVIRNLFHMEGLICNGKINFLGWSPLKSGDTQTELSFEIVKVISQKLTRESQNLIKELLCKSKLQKGWFRVEFLIDFEKDSAVMTNVNVGRDGGAMF